MFASEMENDCTSVISRLLTSKFSDQANSLRTETLNLKPQRMEKFYASLLFAISIISKAFHLHFFPSVEMGRVQLQKIYSQHNY